MVCGCYASSSFISSLAFMLLLFPIEILAVFMKVSGFGSHRSRYILTCI